MSKKSKFKINDIVIVVKELEGMTITTKGSIGRITYLYSDQEHVEIEFFVYGKTSAIRSNANSWCTPIVCIKKFKGNLDTIKLLYGGAKCKKSPIQLYK